MIPILISAFAFNFNNFNLIYLLTAGGPQMVGGNAGETDLLVTYTYNIAFLDSGTNYGLAERDRHSAFHPCRVFGLDKSPGYRKKGKIINAMTSQQKTVMRIGISHVPDYRPSGVGPGAVSHRHIGFLAQGQFRAERIAARQGQFGALEICAGDPLSGDG